MLTLGYLSVSYTHLDVYKRQEFGQRHFIVDAPDGVLIDVIRPIPPSDDHAALYNAEALPT